MHVMFFLSSRGPPLQRYFNKQIKTQQQISSLFTISSFVLLLNSN